MAMLADLTAFLFHVNGFLVLLAAHVIFKYPYIEYIAQDECNYTSYIHIVAYPVVKVVQS